MAVHNLDFSAQLTAWVDATVEDVTQVFHRSTIFTVHWMQLIGPSTAYPTGQGGQMPVATGWLRASIRVSLGDMAPIDPDSYPPPNTPEDSIPYDREATEAAIRAAPLGSTISISYTAAYAEKQDRIRHFVGWAASLWPGIVRGEIEIARGG